jgi:ribosomal protein L11
MMKTVTILAFSVFVMLTAIQVPLLATTNAIPSNTTAPEQKEEEIAKILNARLIEIQEMDLSSMTRAERRALRQEVRAINGQLKSMGDGIYLSVGAILIIILLLILIL